MALATLMGCVKSTALLIDLGEISRKIMTGEVNPPTRRRLHSLVSTIPHTRLALPHSRTPGNAM